MLMSLFSVDIVGVGHNGPNEQASPIGSLTKEYKTGRLMFWSNDGYCRLPTVQKETNVLFAVHWGARYNILWENSYHQPQIYKFLEQFGHVSFLILNFKWNLNVLLTVLYDVRCILGTGVALKIQVLQSLFLLSIIILIPSDNGNKWIYDFK